MWHPPARCGPCARAAARLAPAGCRSRAQTTRSQSPVTFASTHVGRRDVGPTRSGRGGARALAEGMFSHGGPIRRRKRGYNLTTDQSDAGSTGIIL
eukprot:3683972-Pyramimonas_sp.AAC.1